MKAICIIRTSTQSQEIESQKNEIVNYAKSFGYNDDEIMVIGKQGASAIKVDESYQANISELFATIEANNDVEVVFSWSIDRIGRKQTLLHSIKDFLTQHNVNLIIKNPALKLMENGVVNDGVDLAFSLFAAMAEQEMKHKKERFARARRRNQTIGKYNGGKVKYGYKVDDNGFLCVDETTSKEVKLIFNLYATEKYSISELIAELDQMGIKISNKGRLHKVLTDKAYIGNGAQKLQPIISEKQFKKVQIILSNNQIHKDRQSKRNYFAIKLLRCNECGHNYIVDGKVYRCYGRRENECENSLSINHKFMDGLLWTVAQRSHSDYLVKSKDSAIAELNNDLQLNELKLANYTKIESEYKAKTQKVQEGYEDGIYTQSERATRISNLKDKFNEKVKELKELEARNVMIKQQLFELSESDENSMRFNMLLEAINNVGKKVHSHVMAEIVQKYVAKVELRKVVDSELKATQITITMYNGKLKNYVYIPHSKGAKLYVIGHKGQLIPTSHYSIERDENDMVTVKYADYSTKEYKALMMKRLSKMKKGEAN